MKQAQNRAYIAAVCQALASDAANLEAALQKATPKTETPAQAQNALESWVNQWIGGLEQLRWHKMEKAWMAAQTSATARYSRTLSESVLSSWNSLWLSWYDATSLTPTTPTRFSLCRYLEASGHKPLAEQLNARCQTAHFAMQSLMARSDWETQMASTIKSLKSLQTMAEAQVTEAVGITLGFTSADGD